MIPDVLANMVTITFYWVFDILVCIIIPVGPTGIQT